MADDLTTAIIEIRLLIRAFIDRVDPPLHSAVAHPESVGRGCTGCPLCTLVTSLRGEHREFIAELATQALRVVDALREYATDPDPNTPTESEPESPPAESAEHQRAFEPIEVRFTR